uniref:B-cell receptor CD22-like isoform X2 n=1 Tax=Doryrhamphus excisus TaxID=161450 RepID=UPI0025ADE3A8|nr:B-cell receptor CD22-like isoform X2 [Doryrhamphus excisus]
MPFWRQNVFVVLLLTGSVGVAARVRYHPSAVCAVKGSTVTIGCTFTPIMEVIRVVWCINHLICHGSTPSVYDSAKPSYGSRYQYLGDLEGNCTLRIHDVREADSRTFRFRMEAADALGHFTGTTGAKFNVIDNPQMLVLSSTPAKVSEGDRVTLSCASRCSFQQLEVRWFQDGNHVLSESGPALQLGSVTKSKSGNYTCALAKDMRTTSLPFSLKVEARQSNLRDGQFALTLGLAFGLMVVLLFFILLIFIIKRKCRVASCENVKGLEGETEQKHSEHVYCNFPSSAEPAGQEMSHSALEINYASIRFKQTAVSRPVKDSKEFVVYSAVASTLR